MIRKENTTGLRKEDILAGPLYITLPEASRIKRSKRENTSQLGW